MTQVRARLRCADAASVSLRVRWRWLGMMVLLSACGSVDEGSAMETSEGSADVGDGDGDDGGELCEPVADTFDAAGGALELCGARVEIATGMLVEPTTFSIAVVDAPSATLLADRALDGRVFEITADPPLAGDEHVVLLVEHVEEETVRGLGRLRADAAAWEKVAAGEAITQPFRTRVQSLGHFAALRDTRADSANDPSGVGTVLTLEADYQGQTWTCAPADETNAYATMSPELGWAVTANCRHFVDVGEDWALRVDLGLDATMTGELLATVSMWNDDGSWGYVFLADWMPEPVSYTAAVVDGVIEGETNVMIWMGPEDGREITVRWRIVTEGFHFTD